MTEYVDKALIGNMLTAITDDEELIINALDSLPTAYVVGKEKIDKAIEEIKEQSYLSYDDNPRRVLDEECVLEILKRNIGDNNG